MVIKQKIINNSNMPPINQNTGKTELLDKDFVCTNISILGLPGLGLYLNESDSPIILNNLGIYQVEDIAIFSVAVDEQGRNQILANSYNKIFIDMEGKE